ncbi:hypothetical protein [Actinophytocola sp.]|uniref:hypothetical protein n=1 Tax=Actinophytocola sp. TaxID=1872138 RepID=UPI002ED66BA8
MKLQGTKWRTLVSTVRLGGKQYRVIRPARPIRHAPLYKDLFGAQLTVDKAATIDLATAWWLAARSRHSMVYLPLRATDHTCGDYCGDPRLDLVLLHHSLGFPVSRWKEVRARLANAVPHTVRLPAQPFPELTPADHTPKYRYHDYQDHLRWKVAANTLFLIGSRRAFELEGDQVRELAEDSPARLAEDSTRHTCAQLLIGRLNTIPDRRDPVSKLHIECCMEHW